LEQKKNDPIQNFVKENCSPNTSMAKSIQYKSDKTALGLRCRMNEFRRQRYSKSCGLPIIVDLSCNALPKSTFTNSPEKANQCLKQPLGNTSLVLAKQIPDSNLMQWGEGHVTVIVANYRADYTTSAA